MGSATWWAMLQGTALTSPWARL
jgi:hypothetical protein